MNAVENLFFELHRLKCRRHVVTLYLKILISVPSANVIS